MLTLPAIAGWPDAAAVWLADAAPGIDPAQYGIAGVLFVVLGGVLLRVFAQNRADYRADRADLLARLDATEKKVDKYVDILQTSMREVQAETARGFAEAQRSVNAAADREESHLREIETLRHALERRGQ
jgi:hypothetical protein